MVDVQVSGRGLFVSMAVQAVNRRLVGIGDNHLHCGAGGRDGVDVASGVVALDATAGLVNGEYLGEIADHMAVGARLRVGLAAVCGRIDLDGVIYRATSHTVVVAIEVSGVAGDTLAAADDGRCVQSAVGRVVTGGAAFRCMDLTGCDKRRGRGAVATGTVCRQRCCGDVLFDLGGVVMDMGIEIGSMAGSAGAAVAAVYRGVAMTVDTGDARAVFWRVAISAIIDMDDRNAVTGMTTDAEWRWQN